MKKEINENGFVVFTDVSCFQYIDINTVEWTEQGTITLRVVKRNEKINYALHMTQEYLGEKYIRPLFGKYYFSYCDLVNGVDDNVYEWHNDYEENKVNIAILLYFSDTDQDIGSGIGFRLVSNKQSTGFFYPKEGDVCIINQTSNFQHKLTKQNIPLPRIVASFHYYVDYS